MRKRIEDIKAKGFNIVQRENISQQNYSGYTNINNQAPVDYSKLKIRSQVLDDAIVDLNLYKKINPNIGDKQYVLRAIDNYDLAQMREISDFYYKTNGIYNRILRYMAFMYRYDWYVTPYVYDKSMKKEKIIDGFNKCLRMLDKFQVKKTLGDIALKVLRYGAYYGYQIDLSNGSIALQELPPNYCRSIYCQGNTPAVEFNMKFFDDKFIDVTQRMKILKLFPAEFSKGYALYKQGKLQPEYIGDENGWYLLDPDYTVKFNYNEEDYPAFIAIVPLLIDLADAQELDKKRTMQKLLKLIIQKMPMDKNGDLIFDVDEAQQLHNNAVQMVAKIIGLDVLTTFADVDVADLSDSSAAAAATDDLKRVERQVFNEAGVSQLQFNSEGNIALNNSLLNDVASMYNLLLQFESFLNKIISRYNKQNKKIEYGVQILTTTIYNYQEMAKLYKEQTQLGYSKMLPQIALGQSQSSILANAYFENEILDLVNVFIPPLMSSTMNAEILNKNKGASADGEEKTVGRKEKPDSEKSDKTIMNKESMN